MAQIIVGIVDIVGILVYLFGPWRTHLLPDQFSLYPYLIGFSYILIVYINYSIYHTSYSLSRNYYIDCDGFGYNSGNVIRLQNLLMPPWYIPSMVLQSLLNLTAFFWLLIGQGIVPAVSMFLVSFTIGIWMPINYPFFLHYIKRHLANLGMKQHLAFAVMNVDLVTLTDSVNAYIEKRANLHNLYFEKVIAAAKQKVEEEGKEVGPQP